MNDIVCPKCKESVKSLTRDHLLPRWILMNLPLLGITRKRQKEIMAVNVTKICSECNLIKGGYPEYENAHVRRIMKEVANKILEDINEYELSVSTKQ